MSAQAQLNPQNQAQHHKAQLSNQMHKQQPNEEFNENQYEEMHWVAAYIDNKYYMAHPLALDKLLKLEQQIKLEKSKLNVTNLWDKSEKKNQEKQGGDGQNFNDQTIHSDSPNLISSMEHKLLMRPDSSLSRDCKTEINYQKQFKAKAEIQKELVIEEERYRKKLEDLKNNKTEKIKKNEYLLRQQNNHNFKASQKQSSKKKSIANKDDHDNRSSKKSSKIISNQELSQAKKSHEGSQMNKSQISKNSQVKLENNRYKQEEEPNYISFQPNEFIVDNESRKQSSLAKKSISKQLDNKLSHSQCEQVKRSIKNKSSVSQHQIFIHDKSNHSKSFVINYRKTPSQSKSKQQSQSNHNYKQALMQQKRKDLKSASSIASKLQIQKLNKNIREMQEKLQLIERKQLQIESMQISRIRQLHQLQESRARMRNQIPVNSRISQSSQSNKNQQQNNKINKQEQQQQISQKKAEQQANKSIDKFTQKLDVHKSNASKNSHRLQQNSQRFDVGIYKKKKLNISSSIMSYNYTEDMLKAKKLQLEQLQKQEKNQEIAQLKKIIRELKLERIHHESIIQQLENQQKKKEQEIMKSLVKSRNVEAPSDPNSSKQYQGISKVPTESNHIQDEAASENNKQYYRQQAPTNRKAIRSHKINTYRQEPSINKTKQENINQFVRSKMIKNDSSDLPVPKKDSIKAHTSINAEKVMQKTAQKINNKNKRNAQSKSKPKYNAQQSDIIDYQSPSLSRRGIIIRQVLDNESESNSDIKSYQHNSKNLPYRNQLDSLSPTSSGKKVFELEFIKTNKYNNSDENQELNIEVPDIKVTGFKIPNIPQTPTPHITQQQLTQLSNKIGELFGIKTNASQLYMKKYRNCVIFKTADPKKTVVWHYNGKFYIGGWEQNYKGQGKKTGQGFQYIPDKYYYQGQFYQGKKNGSGSMMAFVTGQKKMTVYNGQWFQGEKHGIGSYYNAQQDSYYQGQFQNNKKQGKGVYKFSDCQFYDGTFTKSIKHGYGTQKFANGDVYKGEYKFGRFHGRGKYYWANGSSYDGHFVDGHREGSGKWRSAKRGGDCYIGEYKKDKKQGRGQYIWNNNCRYDGLFLNDLKHGQGRVEYPDGREIKGFWQNGKLIEIDQKITQNQDSNQSEQPPLKKPKLNQIFETPSKELRYSKHMPQF